MHLVHREELGEFLNQAGLLGTGVEVGVADGRFARSILSRWWGRRLVLVDCWQPQDPAEYHDIQNQDQTHHQRNLNQVDALVRVDPRAEILQTFTPQAAAHFADASLDFIYLDANHSYLAVRDDLRAWFPKLKPGGLMAGHDYLDGYLGFDPTFQGGTLFGVKTAVDEFCWELGRAVAFTTEDPPHLTWYFRKGSRQDSKRITLLTGYHPSFRSIGDISRPNKEKYCHRHGYAFRCRTEGFDPERPPSWSKLLFIREELRHCDWVFWTDADSLIMNSDVPLHWFLDDTCDLILSRDSINGINAGCFFVKNSTWAHKFLERVYQQEQYIHHPWCEQAAIMALYAQDPDCGCHVSLVPNKLFNAYLIDGTYARGDFLLHFPGMKNREVFMKNYLAMASKPLDMTETAYSAKGDGPAQDRPRETFGIIWEGPFFSTHSLALVNRELCRRLIEQGHALTLFPADRPEATTPEDPSTQLLVEHVHRRLPQTVDVHVRHQWPPDFTPPPGGYWVMIQPWEYGSLPREWVGPMSTQLDELWVPSHYVRDCYVQSGVPADRVQVVPNGVDTTLFHPQVSPHALKTRKRFRFLFVGGTIARKGIDLVLAAYTQTFSAADDVCLVIKDMGVGTFYQGQTSEELIRQTQSQPGAPEIEYLDQALSAEDLAGLYTACDCLVHPYRGEGFGLPIAEAMACGLPVLVTGYGAALDFCNDATAYLIPAQIVHFPDKRLGELKTVDHPWLAEPNLQALQEQMRRVVEHPTEARAKGYAAWNHIRESFTWDHAVQVVEQRVTALRQRPIRRLATPSADPSSVSVSAVPRNGRQRVSLSMIVRNEERNLPTCLGSAADLMDESVVVDTGSTDRTKEIAASFGARVFDFGWVDSFAAARNESLRHVTGDWILWLDGDDFLDEENRQRLRKLLANLKDENVAYVMKCLCLPEHDTGAATVVDHVRLFRYHPDLRWEYRVHEQILGALRRQGTEIRLADVVIHHTGYQDPAHRPRKVERDLRLLRLQDRETPDDPFVLFNLGNLCSELNRPAEALPLFRRSLRRSNPQDSIVRKLYALIALCHRQLGQPREALAACREGLNCCPEDVEMLYNEARLLRELGDLPGACARLEQLLRTPPADYFASIDPGLRGYKARLLLGQIYRDQDRAAEAEAVWGTAVAENPAFGPAWLELGHLYQTQGRWREFERAIEKLTGHPQLAQEAILLRARAYLARREFAAARRLLDEVIACEPNAVFPRQLLSQVLLQEGSDWNAAETVLRGILTLAPRHAEARANLAVLLRQLGRSHEVAW